MFVPWISLLSLRKPCNFRDFCCCSQQGVRTLSPQAFVVIKINDVKTQMALRSQVIISSSLLPDLGEESSSLQNYTTSTIDPYEKSERQHTNLYKIVRYGDNGPNIKRNAAIYKCQNLQRNVWPSVRCVRLNKNCVHNCEDHSFISNISL